MLSRADHILHLRNIRDGFRELLREAEKDRSVHCGELKSNLAIVEADLKALEAKSE